MPLEIIVVGAGLAGLAAATALARQGHNVQVLERKTTWEETGSGIQLQTNAAKILEEWGMLEDVKKVAHDNKQGAMRDYRNGLIAYHDFSVRGPAWYSLRPVFKDLLQQAALKHGAKILEGVHVVSVDEKGPSVLLGSGETIACDLIVAADGSNSPIRQQLFPSYPGRKILDKTIWQVTLPLDVVRDDEVLKELMDEHRNVVTVAPGRSVFASPAPHQNRFDLQLIDQEYTRAQDPNPTVLTERVRDLSWLKQSFSDFSPAMRKAIDVADSAFKWRLVEVFDLPSWSSKSGKVVFLGDSCHAMTPFTGQGTAMCLEDAAVLSTLIKPSTRPSTLPSLTERYERIRRPRCEKVLNLARAFGVSWSAKDPQRIAQRNDSWRRAYETRHQPVTADGNAPLATPAFVKWLETYDVSEEVRKETCALNAKM